MPRKVKDSGVEWIGEIPEDWEVVKNKHLFIRKNNIVGEKFADYRLLSLTKRNGIVYRDVDDKEGKLPASFETYQEVKANDLVLCLFDIDISAVFSDVSKLDGMITSAYDVFEIKNNVPMFYKHWFDMVNDGRKYKHYSKSLRYTIDQDNFNNIFTAVPPYSEQQKIANFLDKKTSLIDSAVEKSKQSIEEYKKYKQSLITETVTKGLNPDVEMKDSGIEWIGEIPRHWEVMRLKDLGHVYRGSADKAIKDDEIPVKLVQYTDIYYNRELRYGYDKFLDITVTPSEYRMAKVQKGDLLMTTSSEVIDDIGRACVLVDNFDKHVIGSDTLKVTISDEVMDINFRKYLTENGVYLQKFATMSRGITRYRFNMADFKCLRYPIPPIEEQEEIANFLDTKCKEIDKLINQKERLIKELESYKKSLIYEYVTGKKQVD